MITHNNNLTQSSQQLESTFWKQWILNCHSTGMNKIQIVALFMTQTTRYNLGWMDNKNRIVVMQFVTNTIETKSTAPSKSEVNLKVQDRIVLLLNNGIVHREIVQDIMNSFGDYFNSNNTLIVERYIQYKIKYLQSRN